MSPEMTMMFEVSHASSFNDFTPLRRTAMFSTVPHVVVVDKDRRAARFCKAFNARLHPLAPHPEQICALKYAINFVVHDLSDAVLGFRWKTSQWLRRPPSLEWG